MLLIIGILSCQHQSSTAPHSIIETIKTGNVTALKKILKDNKDINAHYAEYTLLCAAVKSNQKEMVMYLLENGADLNQMSNEKTPLMYAAKYGRLEIAQLLIQKGADKTFLNPRDKTALDYAHRYKKHELVVFLSK